MTTLTTGSHYSGCGGRSTLLEVRTPAPRARVRGTRRDGDPLPARHYPFRAVVCNRETQHSLRTNHGPDKNVERLHVGITIARCVVVRSIRRKCRSRNGMPPLPSSRPTRTFSLPLPGPRQPGEASASWVVAEAVERKWSAAFFCINPLPLTPPGNRGRRHRH